MKEKIVIIGSHHASSCSTAEYVKNVAEKEQKSINEIHKTFEFKNYHLRDTYSSPPLIMNRSQRRKQEKLNRKKQKR